MIKLKYKGIFSIPDGEGSCVITLTDESETRALSIMTHKTMAFDIKAHVEKNPKARMQAVDALALFLQSRGGTENSLICIDAKKDVGFNAFLEDSYNGSKIPLFPDHAVLLSLVAKIELWATEDAVRYFSTPFSPNVHTVALPILGLPDAMLKKALDQAVKEENYETASFIRDEIKRREQAHGSSVNNDSENNSTDK